MKAEEEARYFANESCSKEYQARYQKVKARYEEANKEWHKTQIDKATAQQNELHCDYIRSKFGNDKTVKSFLFHLSAACLNPENFDSLTFCVNGISGSISYGINAKNPDTGNMELHWFPNVYEDIFRYFPPDAPFHAYFATRGRYIANEITYLGAIACYPILLGTSEAKFQKSTRKNAKQEVAMVISLKAMARFAILKTKHFSVCRQAAKLTHAMDGTEYSQTVFYPTLSQYASHVQLITRNGQYVCFQDINDIHAAKASKSPIDHLQSMSTPPLSPEKQHSLPDSPKEGENHLQTMSTLPLSQDEQHSSPDSPKEDENLDYQGKGKSKGKSKGKHKGKGKQASKTPTVSTKDEPTATKSRLRKQTIVVRTFDDTPDETQMMLAHIHNPKLEFSFFGDNTQFWQSLRNQPPPALHLPPLSVKFGTFQHFCNEWKKTERMPILEQVYYRRHLTKFYQPYIQTDTLFEPTMFRFCAFSLYDF